MEHPPASADWIKQRGIELLKQRELKRRERLAWAADRMHLLRVAIVITREALGDDRTPPHPDDIAGTVGAFDEAAGHLDRARARASDATLPARSRRDALFVVLALTAAGSAPRDSLFEFPESDYTLGCLALMKMGRVVPPRRTIAQKLGFSELDPVARAIGESTPIEDPGAWLWNWWIYNSPTAPAAEERAARATAGRKKSGLRQRIREELQLAERRTLTLSALTARLDEDRERVRKAASAVVREDSAQFGRRDDDEEPTYYMK